ncbi:hypothetical protein V6N11_020513 [Hibiscus sabdariffa]|uniref:Uncharacterized protein n=1 Tax=Hibiscus sabdariffa TaxID=183260 RepID=A0ABR2Q925_9ROSI
MTNPVQSKSPHFHGLSSPSRRVPFTCNVCSQRTTGAIKPYAYTNGTEFLLLVDNLNLFHGIKCYVNPDFANGDGSVF